MNMNTVIMPINFCLLWVLKQASFIYTVWPLNIQMLSSLQIHGSLSCICGGIVSSAWLLRTPDQSLFVLVLRTFLEWTDENRAFLMFCDCTVGWWLMCILLCTVGPVIIHTLNLNFYFVIITNLRWNLHQWMCSGCAPTIQSISIQNLRIRAQSTDLHVDSFL